MNDPVPFLLKAEILGCIYHFDGENWNLPEVADKSQTEIFERILTRLNSDIARLHLSDVEPRSGHARQMLEYAVGPENWRITEISGQGKPFERYG